MTGKELHALWREAAWETSMGEHETWEELEPFERTTWDLLAEKLEQAQVE